MAAVCWGMATKVCGNCGKKKDLSEFYQRSDQRYLTPCKKCTRARTRRNRAKKREYYRDYDRRRAFLPHRVKQRREYARRLLATDHGRKLIRKWRRRARDRGAPCKTAYRKKYPQKRLAQQAVERAVRRGTLIRKVCEVCGKRNSEAHHDDYSKPLDVRWLCRKHHAEHHRKQRDAMRWGKADAF
jgi:hypothetical protein